MTEWRVVTSALWKKKTQYQSTLLCCEASGQDSLFRQPRPQSNFIPSSYSKKMRWGRGCLFRHLIQSNSLGSV